MGYTTPGIVCQVPYLQDFIVEGESGDGDSRDDHGSGVGEHDLTDDVSVRLVENICTFHGSNKLHPKK